MLLRAIGGIYGPNLTVTPYGSRVSLKTFECSPCDCGIKAQMFRGQIDTHSIEDRTTTETDTRAADQNVPSMPMPEEFVVSLTRVVMRVEMPQVVEFTQIRQVGRT